MRVVAGVDCHKSSHTAVFLDAVGHVIDQITFPTTEEGYDQALATAQRLGCTEWGVEGAGWAVDNIRLEAGGDACRAQQLPNDVIFDDGFDQG